MQTWRVQQCVSLLLCVYVYMTDQGAVLSCPNCKVCSHSVRCYIMCTSYIMCTRRPETAPAVTKHPLMNTLYEPIHLHPLNLMLWYKISNSPVMCYAVIVYTTCLYCHGQTMVCPPHCPLTSCDTTDPLRSICIYAYIDQRQEYNGRSCHEYDLVVEDKLHMV